jgi:cytochrome-b5 reductase
LEALFTMSSPFAAKYVTGIYLPSAALLVGTAAFKSEWLPYAIALTAVLTGAVLFSSQGRRTDPLGSNSR